jgi:hypothetical protein
MPQQRDTPITAAGNTKRRSIGAEADSRGGFVAAPVQDVRTSDVLERDAPPMHQAAERPERDDPPGRDSVNLVDERCRAHQARVVLEDEQGPEPDRLRAPVVVAVARGQRVVEDRVHVAADNPARASARPSAHGERGHVRGKLLRPELNSVIVQFRVSVPRSTLSKGRALAVSARSGIKPAGSRVRGCWLLPDLTLG